MTCYDDSRYREKKSRKTENFSHKQEFRVPIQPPYNILDKLGPDQNFNNERKNFKRRKTKPQA